MAGGRPTKYDPKYCEMIIEEFAKGGHMRSFAHLIDVETKTLYNWMKEYPEFLQARKKADNAAFTFFNKISIGAMTGKLKGHIPVHWIYQMKNRFPEWTSEGPKGDEQQDETDSWEDPESLT